MFNDEQSARYLQLGHAIQSAVAHDHGLGSKDGSPKHLRTGVNILFAQQAGLAQLLVEKGVITSEEYAEAMIRGLEDEVERYRNYFKKTYNLTVNFL